jgi:hypothetical protein
LALLEQAVRFPSISRRVAKQGAAPAVEPPPLPQAKEGSDTAASSPIESYLDSADGERIVGWAYDPRAPGRRLLIEVSAGDAVELVLANVARKDLAAAGKGDGQHGFVTTLDIGQSAAGTVHARVASTGQELEGSPLSTDVVEVISRSGEGPHRELLRTEVHLARVKPTSPAGAQAARPYSSRSHPHKLFATASPGIDPEGIISRYLAYQVQSSNLDQTLAVHGSLTERMNALHRYLVGDGSRRTLPLPLSRSQIDFLNAPVKILGLGGELSVAAYSFIQTEWEGDRTLQSDSVLRKALHWWCFERSVLIAPDGELVTPSQVRLLTVVGEEDRDREYPLNDSVRRTAELDSSLGLLDLDRASDRALLVCVLILRAARTPYLAQFLPRPAVAQLLRTRRGDDTGPYLDRMLALALTAEPLPTPDDIAAAAALRSSSEARIKRAGFSLSASGSGGYTASKDTAPCYVDDPRISPGLDTGVAVIGPTRAASGLGQAARLSIEILSHTSFKPAVLEFGLFNPAPVGFNSPISAPQLATPRQINLIHMNAQSIPLVFAHVNSSVYDRSYNIGYVFWELDRIPKCFRLALDMLDEIWVASEYNREIFERAAAIPVRNVGMAVQPLKDITPAPRDTLACSMASSCSWRRLILSRSSSARTLWPSSRRSSWPSRQARERRSASS